MRITIGQFFKPTVTVQYPHESLKMPKRFRGHIELVRDPETGKARLLRLQALREGLPQRLHHGRGRQAGRRQEEVRHPITSSTSPSAASAAPASKPAATTPSAIRAITTWPAPTRKITSWTCSSGWRRKRRAEGVGQAPPPAVPRASRPATAAASSTAQACADRRRSSRPAHPGSAQVEVK